MTETAARSRRPLVELAAIALACIATAVLVRQAKSAVDFLWEDLALGLQSRPYHAVVDGAPINCRDMRTADDCLAGFRARDRKSAALWLGNSQVHGINQYRPGQENGPPLLHRRLADRDLDLLAFTQPNANFQEHLALYGYLRTRLPLRVLILPAVFDDLRETGIRATVAPALEDPDTVALLEASEVGRAVLGQRDSSEGADDMAALDQTIQQYTEAALNDWLERHSELWAFRPEARGRLFVELYRLRNTLLGIDSSSKRRVIEERYRANMEAAEAIMTDARARGIEIVAYIAPLRDDYESPYVAEEYDRFRRDVEALASGYGAVFLDLETLVPNSLWGVGDSTGVGGESEIDFMHFQSPGHALLADALGDAIEARLDSPGGRAP